MGRKKDTSCLLFPTFPFSLWSNKGSRAIDWVEVCGSLCRLSKQILDTLSNAPKSQAKGSSVCIEQSWGGEGGLGREATWFFGGDQCWGEHDVSLRGDQGLQMKGMAALSSVFGRLRAAVGTIVDMLICIRLAGTPGGSTGQEERPCLK